MLGVISVSGALDGVRVFLCLAFLIYASWCDLKKREVSNVVWAIFAPLALALTSLQFFLLAPQPLLPYALSITVTSVLSVVLFYAGTFGGADAKALICLSLALPSYPVYFLQPIFSFVSPLFPITTLCNAVLLAALSVFYALIRNCLWKGRTGKRLFDGFEKESRWRKVLTVLCGYKIEVAELEKRDHFYPLEDVYADEKGEIKRKLLVMPKDEEKAEIYKRILKLQAKENSPVRYGLRLVCPSSFSSQPASSFPSSLETSYGLSSA